MRPIRPRPRGIVEQHGRAPFSRGASRGCFYYHEPKAQVGLFRIGQLDAHAAAQVIFGAVQRPFLSLRYSVSNGMKMVR